LSAKHHIRTPTHPQTAFSAIEVLVCIALIGLLTAIALPRFERAHVSANISQAKADLQALKAGLESYKVDMSAYPWQNATTSCLRDLDIGSFNIPTLERLTTPISYLNGATPFHDPFQPLYRYEGPELETVRIATTPQLYNFSQYRYNARNLKDTSVWGQTAAHDVDPYWYFLESSGPDRHWHMTYEILNSMTTDTLANQERLMKTIYDPTNGAVSRGSIWVLGGEPQGYGTSMATVINEANSSRVSGWNNYSN